MDSSTAPKPPSTAASTPASSPRLFIATPIPPRTSQTPALSDGTPSSSPFLHPLQMHRVKETHKAQVEQDFVTGRKLINQYEIIDEIGRGVHGKVKLARSLETGDYVAIKIIQRFSKKRRLGRVTVSPEDKTKREIAILKKIRHPNVVGLLEVIDDPELKKIYMVLEHVELGEIVWRKKGVPRICLYERRRIERGIKGEVDTTTEAENLFVPIHHQKQRGKGLPQRAKNYHSTHGQDDGSLEHGDDVDEADDEMMQPLSRQATHNSSQNLAHSSSYVTHSHTSMVRSTPGSKDNSRTTSRAPSRTSSRAQTPLPTDLDIPPLDSEDEDEDEDVGPLLSISSNHGSASALDGTMYGSYDDPPAAYRGRSPSMADSTTSHMSSVDDLMPHDAFEEDFSYVPCFTIEQARGAFRDTVLGLEYLHYEGIVHRDIKPANLLWTKDHRVKISDFGVSYFGRPIREGETEENISEADATDFDDDLELAKTVGTPAFFAPELCYTDLDIEQPKVTEQIDVWSLGITLYCLIFARIPFMAEDEYKLFQAIAREEVYIPRRRLKAVDPSCPSGIRKRNSPYREEGELVYEDIDDELFDLLRRMLLKDPTERLKLREVKRHPWVLRGVDNFIGWLDDSDPSRKTAGRRIQVDDRELERAVVPITFLERARSTIKKAMGKVIGVTRNERAEGSRRRAVSSATSSGTDNFPYPPVTPVLRESRRSSLRGDESYFASAHDLHEHREPTEHPLAQSLTASPIRHDVGGDPFAIDFVNSSAVGVTPQPVGPASHFDARPDAPNRTISAAASIQTVLHRGHSYTRSMNTPTSALTDRSIATVNEPITPHTFTDHQGNVFEDDESWRGRDVESEAGSRARSVDRGLFSSEDKHAEASVATSSAIAPGFFEQPIARHFARSSISPTDFEKPLTSPVLFQHLMHAHQSSSAPNIHRGHATSNLDEGSGTRTRTPEGDSPAPRLYGASTPESYKRAQNQIDRRRAFESDAERRRREIAALARQPSERGPPSPDDDLFFHKSSDERVQSYSSINSASAISQSEVTSPTSSTNLGSTEQIAPGSVPSLPALISGPSSACDSEGDFLQEPGYTQHNPIPTLDSTPGTITPPLTKQPQSRETEAPNVTDTDEEGYNGDGDTLTMDGNDDDSDSDEGLTMTRTKAKVVSPSRGLVLGRRNTNASVGSTETAKKVQMDS
ncbi:hypothetical protein B7494_g8528 [Chlorociboria aeruginascens]|nr:hypothetical protein B7494_g8528 [Chlorociboria aeruginascens]